MANLAKPSIENTGKINCLTNPEKGLDGKKNAAPSAKGNGVQSHKKAVSFRGDITPNPRRNAMSLYGKTEHKKVAKSLGYALTLGAESARRGLTIILMARLSDQERAALAFAALNSLSDDHAYMTASVAPVLHPERGGSGMKIERTLDELLYYMASLTRQVDNDWEANFARSMLRHAKRPTWKPSEKQLQVMQRMVAEMFAHGGAQEDDYLELIDMEDRVYAT